VENKSIPIIRLDDEDVLAPFWMADASATFTN